ncbi:hypothetical protein E4U54_008191 [Claviceps lovelessii]|nr:hypothetical protein E4U54_008191 [Claviceps lovelessii]
MASFSFGFSGDDIDADAAPERHAVSTHQHQHQHQPSTQQASAFPIPGNPHHLPPQHHDLASMLAGLPSKIAYSTLEIRLEDGHTTVMLPRRELWDVRVQLMAEAAAEHEGSSPAGGKEGQDDEAIFLGAHDVKTGVYEGGFKSWESSGDLVKVLGAECHPRLWEGRSARIIELGCGTALPSLALFQWAMALKSAPSTSPSTPTTTTSSSSSNRPQQQAISFILADYNPTVLQLVTLPNFILSWALHHHQRPHSPLLSAVTEALSLPGELELTPPLLDLFRQDLSQHAIRLSFLSGGWSTSFLDLMYSLPVHPHTPPPGVVQTPPRGTSLLLGAETIYSPLALQTFRDMVLSVLEREAEADADASAWVAAKKLYFGVGGSLDDFVAQLRSRGLAVENVREETDGVRRGVVRCVRPR